MKESYQTVDGKAIPLKDLDADDKAFLAKISEAYERGENFLNFKHLFTDPAGQPFRHAKRVEKPVAETALYQVCKDLARRLGMRQGYVVKESTPPYGATAGEPRRELTTGQVAEMAGCTTEAVRRAIRTWRLPARMVGRLALVWEKDAEVFARAIRPYRGIRRKKAVRKEPVHA